ncbi:Zinc-type alcohol dehydrogenase-like protein [Sparassis crispa]|uniref:Zinc-type alcohol dehydrogenase-like protein n=1 Tax=Sparassis crispa TaxID=139825 RepID=A0A401H534_9APHY|nr:Zinc-type alcohol dehydrogenase-like protein [Sparassis crispa]GBE89547.1 Zinc-type alcohol dehydrogenase-like protein [Sparassis crispa]
MAPVTNGRLLFNEVPTGYPEPGKTTVYDPLQTIDLENVPLNGGVLIKTLVLSIDPYLRGRMRDVKVTTYYNEFQLGKPIDNFGLGVILRSEDPSFEQGDHVFSNELPFQHYSIFKKQNLGTLRVFTNEEKLPWSAYVGVCGIPGMFQTFVIFSSKTAYMAWKEYAYAKKGEVAYVTAGSGAVGCLVIQLAKADGLKVIASAGTDKKVAYLRELGADVAFNYKTVPVNKVLQNEGPIDIYWDNVGGESFEAAIATANRFARFIECGAISGYNTQNPYHVKNLELIVRKELKISGFIVDSLYPKYEEQFFKEFPKKVASGEIKYSEDVTEGLENAGQAILDVQIGRNNGKKVIRVASE